MNKGLILLKVSYVSVQNVVILGEKILINMKCLTAYHYIFPVKIRGYLLNFINALYEELHTFLYN